MNRLAEWFLRNPVAWILLAFLLISIWEIRQIGRDLLRVCELTGPHDVSLGEHARTPREKITNICIGLSY